MNAQMIITVGTLEEDKMEPKFDISIKWEDDDSPDNSWLGEFKGREPADEAYINRKTGVFVNPEIMLTKEFETFLEANSFMKDLDDLDISYSDWGDEEEGGITVEYPYYEEVSSNYRRNEYEYYVSCNFPHPKPEEYKYFIQDFHRLEDYGEGWNSMGCIVTVSLQGIELGHNSLWGIESDADDECKREVEQDITAGAIEEAKKNLVKLMEDTK